MGDSNSETALDLEQKPRLQKRDRGKPQPCDYRGCTGFHTVGEDCPACSKQCRNCGRRNHFTAVCKNKARNESNDMQGASYKFKPNSDLVKKTTEEEMDSSDDEFISQTVNHLSTVKHMKSISSTPRTVAMRMNDVDVRVEPDSGPDVNVMDEHQFKALSSRSAKKITLEASRMKLRMLQNELPEKGEFYTTLKNKTCETIAKVIVIRGHINSPPLICKDSLEELGILQICEDG